MWSRDTASLTLDPSSTSFTLTLPYLLYWKVPKPTMPRLTTLPTLLAQLPAFGNGALVQPVAWKERFPNSFYKITRTKLRVKPATAGGAAAGDVQYLGRTSAIAVAAVKEKTAMRDEVKGKAKDEDEEFGQEDDDAFSSGEEMEIGQVTSAVDSSATASASTSASGSSSGPAVDLTGRKAHGQAWGVLFWNGEFLSVHSAGWLVGQHSLHTALLSNPTSSAALHGRFLNPFFLSFPRRSTEIPIQAQLPPHPHNSFTLTLIRTNTNNPAPATPAVHTAHQNPPLPLPLMDIPRPILPPHRNSTPRRRPPQRETPGLGRAERESKGGESEC